MFNHRLGKGVYENVIDKLSDDARIYNISLLVIIREKHNKNA